VLPLPNSGKYASAAGVRVPACDRLDAAIAEFISASQVSLSEVGPLPRTPKSASISDRCHGNRLSGSVRECDLTWFMMS
jgi:hypothetical protein